MKNIHERVDPGTLTITHVFNGEEVVMGGEDGQVWIATFADATEAARHVTRCITLGYWPAGVRQVREAEPASSLIMGYADIKDKLSDEK
jgi:hypothetical protein